MFACCLQNIQWHWTLYQKHRPPISLYSRWASVVMVCCTSFRMKILLQLFYSYTSIWQTVTAFTWKIYFWLKLSWDRSKGTWLISHTRTSHCDILQHTNGCDEPCHEKVKSMKQLFHIYLPRIIQSTVYKDRIIKTSTSFCGDLARTDSSMYRKQFSLHEEYLQLQLF